jgi:hypothetical protein
LANKKIDGLIPTRKQTKEKIGKLNPNKYHKDNIYTFLDNTMNHTKILKNQTK